MSNRLTGISSMATRGVLADLSVAFHTATGTEVAIEAVGGVDAAKRVSAGEAFDTVVLAADVIDRLIGEGRVLSGSRVDLVRSGVAVAVHADAPLPDLSSEEAVKQAVLAAPSIGYSTGPSGVYLQQLFQRWGIAEQIQGRTVQAKPGVPVGSWVASGEIALGFQQLSELIHLQGITVVGMLPPAIQIETVFSAGICSTSNRPEATRALLAWLASDAATAAKRRHGMTAA